MSHLRALKWLNLVFAALFAAGSLFGLAFVAAGVAQWSKDREGATMFILFGALSVLFFTVFVAVHDAGFMVAAGRGRVAQTFLALLHLVNAPLGTAYALYAMWICFINNETVFVFDHPAGRRVR
jgi:uncharacterized membrane protein